MKKLTKKFKKWTSKVKENFKLSVDTLEKITMVLLMVMSFVTNVFTGSPAAAAVEAIVAPTRIAWVTLAVGNGLAIYVNSEGNITRNNKFLTLLQRCVGVANTVFEQNAFTRSILSGLNLTITFRRLNMI